MNAGEVSTRIIIVATIILLVCYNLWVSWQYGSQATISHVIFTTCRERPWLVFLVSFLLGFACGHFFAPLQGGK